MPTHPSFDRCRPLLYSLLPSGLAGCADYADEFRARFGEQIFEQPEVAFERALFAIQRYEQEDIVEFAPFPSKYDLFLSGKAPLSNPELRGPALFNNPLKGNCAANADPGYFDLGLCGPQRIDRVTRLDLCGAFKVPMLRNIALTAPYFHHGRFATLQQALRFEVPYNRLETRTIHAFYPSARPRRRIDPAELHRCRRTGLQH